MVRLLVLFAPAFAIIAAIGIMGSVKPFFALLREAPHTLAKSKRRLPRVSKEYSGIAAARDIHVAGVKLCLLTPNRRHTKS